MITDSQVHLWDANRPERPWSPDAKPHLAEPMTGERMLALMDDAGVDRAVISPLYLPGHGPAYAIEVCEKYPTRFAIMGWLQPADPSMLEQLDRWLEIPGMCSARINLNEPHGSRWLNDGTMEQYWEALERNGIPVGLFRLEGADVYEPVVQRHPGLKLVVDHMNQATPEVREERVRQLETLAKYPNVTVKVSTLPRLSGESYPFGDVHEMVKRVYNAFGPNRMLWGTDHTQSMARDLCDYKQHVDIMRHDAAKYIPADDLQLIMGGALAKWFNWPEGKGAGGLAKQ